MAPRNINGSKKKGYVHLWQAEVGSKLFRRSVRGVREVFNFQHLRPTPHTC